MTGTSKFLDIWKLMTKFNFEVDKESINEDMMCIICKRLLIDACQGACGCLYCHTCIDDYLKEGEKFCPGGKPECNEDVLIMGRDVTRSRAMNNKIYGLTVCCPNSFCDAKVLLPQMEDHLKLCSSQCFVCPYVSMGCTEAISAKVSIQAHMHIETLSHSKLLIDWMHNVRTEMEGLKDSAATVMGCLTKVKDELRLKEEEIAMIRAEMDVLRDRCGDQELTLKVLTAEMESSKEASGQKDSRIMNLEKESRDKDTEMIEIHVRLGEAQTECRGKDVKISSLEQAAATKEIQMTDLVQQMIAIKKENQAAKEEARNIKNIVDSFNRHLRENRKDIQAKIEALRMDTDKKLKRKKSSSEKTHLKLEKVRGSVDRSLSTEMVPGSSIGGLSYTLDGFSGRRDGERLVSPYFYSHSNGYKLQLIVYPRQYGGQLSVCFVICKGEFDSLLEWPCPATIGLGIVNQLTGETDAAVTYRERTMHGNCKYLFLRPVDGRDNHPYECRLMRHDSLRSRQSLIVDDAVVIRCTVVLGQ